jgi:hypothetical protein
MTIMAGSAGVARRDRIAALVLVVVVIAGGALLLSRRLMLDDRPVAAHDPRVQRDAVWFDRFAARRERSDEGDRLSVTLRLRTSASVSRPCFVFLVARNEQSTPRRWAAWPEQSQGPAVSAGGHFHGATPTAGFPVTLSEEWERVSATIPQPPGGEHFDTVIVYVVDPAGRILLARPFRV